MRRLLRSLAAKALKNQMMNDLGSLGLCLYERGGDPYHLQRPKEVDGGRPFVLFPEESWFEGVGFHQC